MQEELRPASLLLQARVRGRSEPRRKQTRLLLWERVMALEGAAAVESDRPGTGQQGALRGGGRAAGRSGGY